MSGVFRLSGGFLSLLALIVIASCSGMSGGPPGGG